MTIGRLQLTLAILKPDIIANPIAAKAVHKIILDNDFFYVNSRPMLLSRNDAERFYKEHKGRFFYNRLVNFMSSGPISAHILARHDAILTWRNLMGPTKVFRAVYESPNSIRGRFGLTDTRNSTHGSDSDESAKKEINFFFPETDVDAWYSEEEEKFRTQTILYNASEQQHRIA